MTLRWGLRPLASTQRWVDRSRHSPVRTTRGSHRLQEETLVPGPQLMESMRAVGYTPQTSVADIIDNSIAAGAANVWVDFTGEDDPHIRITDDGRGMDEAMLIEAMRMAGRNATQSRAAEDLGRFGLGLKTASMAQCRSLTVVTKQAGVTRARRWDLDHLAATQSWTLLKLDEDEIQTLPGVERLAPLTNGTLVIWENLDRLTASIGPEPSALDEAMAGVRDHLALVFHRFISGSDGSKIAIFMNSRAIAPADPFLAGHRATMTGPTETIIVEGQQVEIKPYTLPFLNKLSAKDRSSALFLGQLHETQGFYVYRGRRLVTWGSWFRLAPRSQLAKLARVRVDIPNALDHLWSLDIKKSTASPPPQVRRELKRLAEKMIEPSGRVQRYRGRKVQKDDTSRVWHLNVDRETFSYQVNRENPAIRALVESCPDITLSAIDALIRVIESSLPLHDIHNRLGQDETPAPPPDPSVRLQIAQVWGAYEELGKSREEFVEAFSGIEPFSSVPNFEQLCIEEIA